MDDLYIFSIYTIELIYKYIYLGLVSIVENYGLALLALSLLNHFLLIPLNKLVRGVQQSESNIQQVLAPQLHRIKETSRDAARHQRVLNLYQRYSYHPIFAIRNVLPLLVQLPFLMAVYFMLSSLPHLDKVSFLFLQDLSKPDDLFFGLNIMPVIMTLVNLVSACFVVRLSKPQRKQAIIVALLFFALLYNAPSALLLYWTMNNVFVIVFSLLSKISFVERVRLSILAVKQRVLPSLIESSGLLLGLCFIVPLYFTVGLNVHYFSEAQIVNLFVFFVSAIICSFAIGIVFDKLIIKSSQFYIAISLPFKVSIEKNGENTSARFRIGVRNISLLFIAALAAYFIVVLCIDITLYFTNFVIINLFHVTVIGALFYIIRKKGLKVLNIAMLSLLVFCSFQFTKREYKNVKSKDSADLLIATSYENFPMDEKLENKSNIYLVLLESYMSPKTLRETYRFDNSAFENRLERKGFTVYNDIYSHSPFTKGSMLTLMLMNNSVVSTFLGNEDVSTQAHNLFGGSADNLLFNYLKRNDYVISCFYDSQNYYFKNKGPYLDYGIDEADNSLQSILKEIAPTLSKKIRPLHRLCSHKEYKLPDSNIYPAAFKHIASIKKLDKPSFFLLKPHNDLHCAKREGNILDTYQSWIESGIYQRGVSAMNKELSTLIDEIESHDPNSVIILLGDHGHKYYASVEGHSLSNMTPRAIRSKYPHLHMSNEEIVEDMFSVFVAIKMPDTAKGKLDIDETFAYADLFRYVFAALDNNPTFVEHKTPNVAINTIGITVKRDNKIIENGENTKK